MWIWSHHAALDVWRQILSFPAIGFLSTWLAWSDSSICQHLAEARGAFHAASSHYERYLIVFRVGSRFDARMTNKCRACQVMAKTPLIYSWIARREGDTTLQVSVATSIGKSASSSTMGSTMPWHVGQRDETIALDTRICIQVSTSLRRTAAAVHKQHQQCGTTLRRRWRKRCIFSWLEE